MVEEQTEGSIQVKLIRGAIDSLSLYEITDYELGILENGVANSRPLEFSVIILLASLILAGFFSILKFGLVFIALIVITIIGIGSSVLSLIFWKRNCSRAKLLCAKIRNRIPAESMRKSNGRTQVPHIPVAIRS